MRAAAALVALALVSPLPAVAQEAQPGAWGEAHSTCGHWTAEWAKPTATPDRLAMLTWLLGFVQHSALEHPERWATQDVDSVKGWTDQFCRASPTRSLLEAAMYLDVSMAKAARR